MTSPLGYYISTLSFTQEQVPLCTVRLIFLEDRPEWLRVYDCDTSGTASLLKDLRPLRQDRQITEYLDIAKCTGPIGQGLRLSAGGPLRYSDFRSS